MTVVHKKNPVSHEVSVDLVSDNTGSNDLH